MSFGKHGPEESKERKGGNAAYLMPMDIARRCWRKLRQLVKPIRRESESRSKARRWGDRCARAAAGRHTEDDVNCVTYCQRACDELVTTVRSADVTCPGTGCQRNRRSGQIGHRPDPFGPFPGGRRGRRPRPGSWRRTSSRSSHLSVLLFCATHEECGAG